MKDAQVRTLREMPLNKMRGLIERIFNILYEPRDKEWSSVTLSEVEAEFVAFGLSPDEEG